MECDCLEHPDIWEFEPEDYNYDFLQHLTRVQAKFVVPDKHSSQEVLYSCPENHIYWKIDAGRCWAIRILDPEKWMEFDDEPLKQQYMTDKYGGPGELKCARYECPLLSLRDVVWCAKHAGR